METGVLRAYVYIDQSDREVNEQKSNLWNNHRGGDVTCGELLLVGFIYMWIDFLIKIPKKHVVY